MENTKEISWLEMNYLSGEVRVIDCRYKLDEPDYGKRKYEQDHIPGAVYFDLEEDLSGKVKEHGGRHPLPKIEEFVSKLEKAGIGNDTVVVIYDGGEEAFASRCWWLLKYIGHRDAFVLNGGYPAWKKRNLPVTKEVPYYNIGQFAPHLNEGMVATVEDVRKVSRKESEGILIDSRSRNRYLGLVEPIDKVPGHIPGAVNYEWTEALENGRFLSDEDQHRRWEHLDKEKPLIVYCGSGVTAVPNILSLWSSGHQKAKLYPGSYSDWISYDGHEVETKEN
ncbi:sulfurtransferase [Bacillus salacetis]|uniref:Sulfurtransferase n=1 Tax=Bacillus salacetis TaxID=2315464 RepID=A0A3A1QWT5_9BACI|nr:sulfurtransferase [Bacillus salacetis]RIW33086.1 sulfurtransferase [Bacillus salacetis]